MELKINYKVNRKVDAFLMQSKARNNLLVGSAGSGKSWGLALWLLFEKAICEPYSRFLITRTTGPSLRNSCWLLINDILNTYEMDVRRNLATMTLTFPNRAQMYFVPLGDISKFKSMEKMNYVWAEEATQLSYQEYLQLGLRCRGENKYSFNQLYFTFNPDDEHSFLKPLCENPPEGTAVCHSTYKDNAFLGADYIADIERLRELDPVYWKIYGEGIWATPSGLIYSNWDILKADSWPADDWFDDIIYGLDFGFNNPTALLEIGVKENELWEREIIYKSGMTNTDLINEIQRLNFNTKRIIYADAAEPDRIQEISQAGFNIHPARKGKNSVLDGIDTVKKYKVHIHEDSTNHIAERRGYKWRIDKNGNVIDEPVAFKNHSHDCERYAIFSYMNQDIVIKAGKVYI